MYGLAPMTLNHKVAKIFRFNIHTIKVANIFTLFSQILMLETFVIIYPGNYEFTYAMHAIV